MNTQRMAQELRSARRGSSNRQSSIAAPRQVGFALVTALFLIVVLAMIGLFAVNITNGQRQTVDLALLSSRALNAAKAGIEYAAYRALHGNCSGDSFTLSDGALQGFTIDVTCEGVALSEQGVTVNNYTLTSIARFGIYGQPGYVQRQVSASFNDAP